MDSVRRPMPADDLQHELSRHAGSLRSLAQDLLRCPHLADDAAQEAMVRAVRHRQQLRSGPLGGWLHRTLTNFSRQLRRGERRREAREQQFVAQRDRDARDAATPVEALQRREMLRHVTDAVLSLDEPYQTVVMLRYFEGLPPRQIARSTGCNVATVKSRLARGLAQLRLRLAREHGDGWRAALIVTFAPLGVAAGVIPLTTGILMMKTTTLKVTLAAAALCVGGFALYRAGDAPAPALPAAVGDEPSAPAAQAAVAGGDAPAVRERVPDAPEDEVAEIAAMPYLLALEVHVVDEHGLPVKGYSPRLAPPGGDLQSRWGSTDEHGVLRIELPARAARAAVEILDPRRHRRLVQLQAGAATRLTLVKPASEEQLVAWGTKKFVASSYRTAALDVSAQTVAQTEPLHPGTLFVDPALVSTQPEEEEEPGEYELLEVATLGTFSAPTRFTITRSGRSGALVELDAGDLEPEVAAGCALEGYVFGEDGRAAVDVPVVLLGEGPQPIARTVTDKHGQWRLEGLVMGPRTLRAGGGPEGLATQGIEVTAGVGAGTATLNLHKDACVRGVLIDPTGAPVAGATVDWHAADGSWADRTTTGDDGAFVLANMPPAVPGTLTAWNEKAGYRMPVAVRRDVRADAGPVTLTATAVDAAGIACTLAEEHRSDPVRLRVRQLDTGFSRSLELVRERGPESGPLRWRLEHLIAGHYELELWLPGIGAVPLGRHWLEDEATCDLGMVSLPPPARLHFDLPNGQQPPDDLRFELIGKRRDFDVEMTTMPGVQNDLLLPPGDYVLLQRRSEGPVTATGFSVRAGATVSLAVSW